MSFREHIGVFFAASLVWVGFLIAGLPSYYQQYSTAFMVWFDAIVLIPICAVAWIVLRRFPAQRRMTAALWMAFYFTVPLAVYDWLYCAVFLGHGPSFLWRFWYLSVYYAIPWIVLPGVATTLNRFDERRRNLPAS